MSSKSNDKPEPIELIKPLIGAIVHRVRTPLSSINMGASAIEQVLPELFQAYQLAVDHDLIDTDISDDRLEMLKLALPNIKEEIQKTSDFLSCLIEYANKISFAQGEMPVLSMKACVNQALTEYPFARASDKELLHIDIQSDFNFKLSQIFIEDLLLNLIDNALRAITKAGKGEITISTGIEGAFHCLYFKDTATGLSSDQLSRIFSRYISVRNDKTKAGLGFCRLAIVACGGQLSCESVEGGYTLFKICFPIQQ